MVVDMLAANWTIVVGLGLFGLLAFFALDERRQGNVDGAADTVERVGERTDAAFGEFLGAVGALAFSLVMVGVTLGQQILETASMIEPLIGNAPVVVGHVVVAGLGYLSLEGTLGLSAKEYGFVVLFVTAIALMMRYGRSSNA